MSCLGREYVLSQSGSERNCPSALHWCCTRTHPLLQFPRTRCVSLSVTCYSLLLYSDCFLTCCAALCFADGDIDSLLDNAILDSNEPSPLSSSQESAEERSNKSPRVTHSPKDPHTHLSKDSPKDTASSTKDTCSGKAHMT